MSAGLYITHQHCGLYITHTIRNEKQIQHEGGENHMPDDEHIDEAYLWEQRQEEMEATDDDDDDDDEDD